MTKPREEWSEAADLERALLLERRAMQSLVGNLILHHLPYETVNKLCYDVCVEVVRSGPIFQEKPGLVLLVDHALECVGTLIDEMTSKPDIQDR